MTDPATPPANDAAPWDIDAITHGLDEARARWRASQPRHADGAPGFPSRRALEEITADLCAALFPRRLGPGLAGPANENGFVREVLDRALQRLRAQVRLELGYALGEADPHAANL
ncbi:MAG: serine acetyltransferase, partial [Alphaproteobacteria bacterium]